MEAHYHTSSFYCGFRICLQKLWLCWFHPVSSSWHDTGCTKDKHNFRRQIRTCRLKGQGPVFIVVHCPKTTLFSKYSPGLPDWDKRAKFLVVVKGQCRPKSGEQQQRNDRRLSQSASPGTHSPRGQAMEFIMGKSSARVSLLSQENADTIPVTLVELP